MHSRTDKAAQPENNSGVSFSFVIYTEDANSRDISNRTIRNVTFLLGTVRLSVTLPTGVMVASCDVLLTFDLYS
jgi:hypothetical protein